jgi:hypothetical protein
MPMLFTCHSIREKHASQQFHAGSLLQFHHDFGTAGWRRLNH